MRNEAITLPLSAIIANGDDLRTTPAMADADRELRASILAHGLLEPLVVRQHNDRWSVVAGHRRHRALCALADAGEIVADVPVGCTVLHDDVDRTEAALAENVVRVAMHPADQVAAFKRLADAGATSEDIAVRFGLAKVTVEKRLRLAALAPEIMAMYRAGTISLESAQAYATTADTEAQRHVAKQLADEYAGNHAAHLVLSRLQKEKLRSDSPLGKFIGDEYRTAGGAEEVTLFHDYSTMSDLELAKRLATAKLETIAARLRETGWKWVELVDENRTWNVWQDYRELRPPAVEATAAERATLEAYHQWDEDHAERDWDELSAEEQAEGERLDQARHAAEAAMAGRRRFTPEQMAAAGVLVYLGRSGEAEFKEGLVRKGDPMPGQTADSGTGAGAAAAPADKPAKQRGYSQALRDNIKELRAGVLREVLREQPTLAQDAVNFSLVLLLFTGHTHSFYPALPLAIRGEHNPRLPVSGASDELKTWLDDPEWKPPFLSNSLTVGEMFDAYRALSQDAKDAVVSEVCCRLLRSEPNPNNPDTTYNLHAALGADADWSMRLLRADESVFSVETFWGKLRKDQIIDEARPCLGDEWAERAGAMKKGELAAEAARRMRAHAGWLPKGFDTPRPEREPVTDAG